MTTMNLSSDHPVLTEQEVQAPSMEQPIAPSIDPQEKDKSEDVEPSSIHEDRIWRENEWTAQVIKNEDDEGWAVAMTREGNAEPALVGPWTMGRNKKDPKPLDDGAFRTLVKTANEVLMRHEQQLRAQLHRNVTIETPDGEVKVSLDITPSDDDPFATLSAQDRFGEALGSTRVEANFKLTPTSAKHWAEREFGSI